MQHLIDLSPLIFSGIALYVSITALRRNRRLENENIVFKEKNEAYKLILRKSFVFIEEVYEVLDLLQDYTGIAEEWRENKAKHYFQGYMPKIRDIEADIFKFSAVLPENFIKEAKNVSFMMSRMLVNSYHFDNQILIDTYEKLCEEHNNLINLARDDLKIKVLQEKLNYRLDG